MWVANGNDIKMTEGDFGIELPITINGPTFTSSDEITFTVKKNPDDTTPVFFMTFFNIVENTIKIKLSQADTSRFSVGTYVYSLDWYQSGVFMCNIIPSSTFRVVDKV